MSQLSLMLSVQVAKGPEDCAIRTAARIIRKRKMNKFTFGYESITVEVPRMAGDLQNKIHETDMLQDGRLIEYDQDIL